MRERQARTGPAGAHSEASRRAHTPARARLPEHLPLAGPPRHAVHSGSSPRSGSPSRRDGPPISSSGLRVRAARCACQHACALMHGPGVARSVRAASTSYAQTSRPVRSTRARAPRRCRAACRQSFTLYSSKLVCGTCQRARLLAACAHAYSGRCRSARCLARERWCGPAHRAGELMHLDLEHRRHAAARSRRLCRRHRGCRRRARPAVARGCPPRSAVREAARRGTAAP